MSVESRKESILNTAKIYNTLVDLDPVWIDRVASTGINARILDQGGYTNHQRAAASLAADVCGVEPEIIIEWCAIMRPALIKEEQNSQPYESWKAQHEKTVQELGKEWAKECQAASSQISRVYYPS